MSYKAQGDTITTAAKAALNIVEDPYLPQVAGLVIRLNQIEGEDTDEGGRPTKGIGLKHAVGPLKLFVKYRENPWLTYAVAGSVIGLTFLAGYMMGRPTRRKGGQ